MSQLEPTGTRYASLFATEQLFGELDEEALAFLEEWLQHDTLKIGEAIFREDDVADAMFVLITGALGVQKHTAAEEPLIVARISPGESLGELGLLTGMARSATVTALEDSQLIKLPREAFDHFALSYPAPIQHFTRKMHPRMQMSLLEKTMIPLVGDIDSEAFRMLERELEWVHLRRGEALFELGEDGDAMYFVVAGRLSAVEENDSGFVRRPDSPTLHGEVGPGESMGETAMLAGGRRVATMVAIRDSSLLRLDRAALERLLPSHPQLLLSIVQRMLRRNSERHALDPATRQAGREPLTLTIVAHRPSLDLVGFARTLREAFEPLGSTLSLNAEQVDLQLGKPGISQIEPLDPRNAALMTWLSHQEGEHRHTILSVDPDWTSWTERALRHSDVVLIVAEVSDDPEPGEIERRLAQLDNAPAMELVLLHPPATRPIGTARWLKYPNRIAHHHVGADKPETARSLARRLCHCSTALVLSGGAARGLSHIGCLRALLERGYHFDHVGGTSMGALLGAMHCMGLSCDEIEEQAHTFCNRRKLFDLTLPITSLLKSDKVTRLYQEVYGDLDIEDLWVPFFCVATNLTRGAPVLQQQGKLWKHIRASTALPIVFAPVLHDRDVIVDGGLINNLPVDIMRSRCRQGAIVAVNASPRCEKPREYVFGDSLSGWHQLWQRFLPLRNRIEAPSLGAILLRALEASSTDRMGITRLLADLDLQVPTSEFGVLEFSRFAEIIELGYSWTLSELDRRASAEP